LFMRFFRKPALRALETRKTEMWAQQVYDQANPPMVATPRQNC
jgi:hypothetical protein